MNPRPTTRLRLIWYAFVRGVLVWFCRIFWRMRIEGTERVPATGAFILAPVHRSNVDTPLVAGVTGRLMHFMGKEEMWKYRWSAWFFNSLAGIAVRRGTPDREAMRLAEAYLARGEPVVVFPEGTRQVGPLVEDVFDGVAYMALRTGTPIVPVGIGGSARAMPIGVKTVRPVRVHVLVGDPIPVERPLEGSRVSRRSITELTDRLRTDIQRLFDDAQAKVN